MGVEWSEERLAASFLQDLPPKRSWNKCGKHAENVEEFICWSFLENRPETIDIENGVLITKAQNNFKEHYFPYSLPDTYMSML